MDAFGGKANHFQRHFVRRAALRAASSSPSTSFISTSRSINTSSPFVLRSKVQQSIAPSVFRRFAHEDAEQAKEQHVESSGAEAESTGPSSSQEFGYPPRKESQGFAPRSPLQDRVLAPTTGIYVGNLLFDVTAADLQKEFEAYGKVKSTIIAQDARGLSKGYA